MKLVCTHCGLPFASASASRDRPVFCCSGCALAFRLSAEAGTDASARPLIVTALGAVFLEFNQMLGAVLATLVPGGAWGAISLALGLATWAALASFQFQAGARRLCDLFAATVCLLAWGAAAHAARPGLAVAACAGFALWAMRGLVRGKISGKK